MNKLNIERLTSKQSYSDGESREFNVSFVPSRSGTFKIEIDGEIKTVSQFSTAIQVLESAKEDDEVTIYLQTCGGSVDAGEAFIHAMRKCLAPIHIVATGGVHSMGTHILMEADSLELSHGFNSLIHCGSDGAYGNVNEYAAKSKFDQEFRSRTFREAYEGFLTDKEIDAVLEGRDIWLDAEGWMKRALARGEYLTEKYTPKPAARKPRKTKAKKELALPQEL